MLKDLLKASRSYRSFDPSVKITDEQLLDWIDHARYCPSSINMQMIKFRPVNSAEECKALLAQTRWAGKLKEIKLPPEGHAPTAYVVLCTDSNIIANAEAFQKDVGICAQTIMLAACEAGFGGCMIGSVKADVVSEALQIPSHLAPQLVLGLGVPNENVVLTEAKDGAVRYYRDEENTHYVPKRPLDEILI